MTSASARCISGVVLAAAVLAPGLGLAGQELELPSLPDDAPPGSGVVEACPIPDAVGEVRCGVFRVAEDPGRPDGRTVDLAFVVLAATGPAHQRAPDPVVLLPGGPGQAFVETAPRRARQESASRRVRDLLLVDVRGVGRSGALHCGVPYPGGFASRFGTLFPPDHVTACRDTLERRADLTRYTTAHSVDDLEALRIWLGYPQVNLSGGSYGTRVAQVYLRRHPDAVRTVVLNGVAPIDRPIYVEHARLLQDVLDRVIVRCAGDGACARANPDLGSRLEEVLGRLRDGPIEVEVAGETVPFGLADLAYALRGLLYGRAAEVPGMITRAAAGDFGPLADFYEERSRWVGEPGGPAGYHLSVLCSEDIDAVTDDLADRATAGTFMGRTFIDAYRTACRIWPHARLPASHWSPVESDVPTLLLSGELDPVTPPEGGDRVADALTHAVHVVVPGGGHGVGGDCVNELIQELRRTASVDGLAGRCGAGRS